MRKRIIAIVFLILLLGVSSLVYFGQRNRELKEYFYSGTIEAKQADLSFQASGRVIEVRINEGQFVEENQLLAVLDQSSFLAAYEQAVANLETSKKNLQKVELAFEIDKKIRPVEVERAEAGVKALRAQLDELESGYRLQDIERARLALSVAKVAMEQAQKDKERYDSLFQKTIVSERELDIAQLQYEKALKEYESAKESLEELNEGFRKENIRAAKAKLNEGEAVLKQAKNNLRLIEIKEKEVGAAQALVRAAEASLRLAEVQLDFTLLKAPFKGIIASRTIEPGEVVSPGQEVISLADLSRVDLKIFIDETEIGNVKPGQPVDVKIDTFPDKLYKGKVTFISPEAEFTPKIIQTHKERVKLVYLVKIAVPNPDLELKPGMPADAWLR
jgi:HlyD family secretion protein